MDRFRDASRPRIALATCAELPHGDADDAPLVSALESAGMATVWHPWDAGGVEWRGFDAVLIRSTWDYQLRRDEFLRWTAGIERLFNPGAVLAWNTDKRYLSDLAEAGVEVVETRFVEPGREPALPGAGEFVVKPSVSAGSKDTARFAAGDPEERRRALELAAEIQAGGRTAMVQPYLDAVDENGETALLYFDGAYSHAIRKGPLLKPGEGPVAGLFAPESIGPRTPGAAERALADRVLKVVAARFGMPLYARVDVISDTNGRPVVLEVELTEPSLFFAHAEGAAERLAAALAVRL